MPNACTASTAGEVDQAATMRIAPLGSISAAFSLRNGPNRSSIEPRSTGVVGPVGRETGRCADQRSATAGGCEPAASTATAGLGGRCSGPDIGWPGGADAGSGDPCSGRSDAGGGGRGSRHPVECHEVWEYDDASGVQRLVRMIALCPACHEVKHIGLAGMKGRGDLACAHLAEVNGWTSEVAARCVEDAFAVWRTRSSRTWALDVSALAAYEIDPAIIAEASEASATGRSRTAASTTTKVRRSQPIPPTDPA
jgi:hypothetical protein